jgi:histidinol-phosphate/aromatic aminotransferase/cobyric acid decarboxylase-like protein
LAEPEYYASRYQETRRLREELAESLSALGLEVMPSVANFLLCHLPANGVDAATCRARCQAEGLFLRDAGTISPLLGTHALRIAVKDAATNRRSVTILARALAGGSG